MGLIDTHSGDTAENASMPVVAHLRALRGLHEAIGKAVGMNEPTRQLLLGLIEGHMAASGVTVKEARHAEQSFAYAAHRALKLAERGDLALEERKERARKELAPYLQKKKEPKTAP